LKDKIATYWKSIRRSLFPEFEKEVGPITNKHQQIMVILDVLEIEKFFYEPPFPTGPGKPKKSRSSIARAFVAKAVLNLCSTRALMDRLEVDPVLRRICGWEGKHEIPCEATFSNAFKEFAKIELTQKVHEVIIKEECKDKIVIHINRDATDIVVREKPKKKKSRSKAKRKRGRPRKEEKVLVSEPKRLEKQPFMSIEQMLSDLPNACDRGTKKNAKGYSYSWNGYKLHLDVADGGIPISAILTSASVHDSQVAIPLETMTLDRVVSLYSLMDAAYDASSIKTFIEAKGKVPIVDPNPRSTEPLPLDPAKKERYKERSTVERSYSRLKDDFGASQIRVKGAAKVMTHLMFGLLSLTAEQLVRGFT